MDADKPTVAEAESRIILDLGKKSKKKLKQLLKGKGSITKKLNEALTELERDGTIDAKTQVVIFVKKKKKT